MNIEKSVIRMYQQELLEHYSARYRGGMENDRPDEAANSIILRINNILKQGIPHTHIKFPQTGIVADGNYVLNIGSGPQSLEAALLKSDDTDLYNQFKFLTLDYAAIPYQSLQYPQRVSHIRGDKIGGTENHHGLPLPDNSMGLVYSNHAIDLLEKEASLEEAFRVMAPGANGIFYFHHPWMIPVDLSDVRTPTIKGYWGHLRRTESLFSSPEEIETILKPIGYTIDEIKYNHEVEHDQGEPIFHHWWEVVTHKP